MHRVLWTALIASALCCQHAQAQIFCCQGCPLTGCGCPFPGCMPTVCGGCPFPGFCGALSCACSERQPTTPWYLSFPADTSYQANPNGPFPGTSYVPIMPRVGHIDLAMQPSTPVYPAQPSAQMQRAMFQPVGYWYGGAAPSYWYGR